MDITVEKVLAYITITKNNQTQLLVFEHPITHFIEVVRGTVEAQDLEQEILREITEESGLPARLFESVNLFNTHIFEVPGGRDRKGNVELQKHYAFHLTLKQPEKMANEWVHIVTGTGVDKGHAHRCFWIDINTATEVMTPQTAYFANVLKIQL